MVIAKGKHLGFNSCFCHLAWVDATPMQRCAGNKKGPGENLVLGLIRGGAIRIGPTNKQLSGAHWEISRYHSGPAAPGSHVWLFHLRVRQDLFRGLILFDYLGIPGTWDKVIHFQFYHFRFSWVPIYTAVSGSFWFCLSVQQVVNLEIHSLDSLELVHDLKPTLQFF